ncbi:MAG: helix-turn-helix transcriptional regulator [Acidimicrobiales bacterium]
MERVDRVERLTDLVLLLLDTPRPLTLNEIADSVVGYPEPGETRRQAFERDKRTLRDEGVVLSVEPVEGGEPGQSGYRIRADDYYLPKLDLSPDEQAALNLAVAGVHLDDPNARGAILKVGMIERDGAAAAQAALAALPVVAGLAGLHEAVRDRATVSFGYRGKGRLVDPYAMVFRGGWWYLVGRDHEHDERRTFRVDRMAGAPVPGPPGAFVPPGDLDLATLMVAGPWGLGDAVQGVAQILVDAVLAGQVVGQLGAEAVTDRRPDGSVVVGLAVANVDAFVSWVLGLLDHAVVLGPPFLREAVVLRLREMLGGPPPGSPTGLEEPG